MARSGTWFAVLSCRFRLPPLTVRRLSGCKSRGLFVSFTVRLSIEWVQIMLVLMSLCFKRFLRVLVSQLACGRWVAKPWRKTRPVNLFKAPRLPGGFPDLFLDLSFVNMPAPLLPGLRDSIELDVREKPLPYEFPGGVFVFFLQFARHENPRISIRQVLFVKDCQRPFSMPIHVRKQVHARFSALKKILANFVVHGLIKNRKSYGSYSYDVRKLMINATKAVQSMVGQFIADPGDVFGE
jgi:hypothetical protein